MLVGAGSAAASDLASQAVSIDLGLQQDFDLYQTARSTVVGGAFGLAFGGIDRALSSGAMRLGIRPNSRAAETATEYARRVGTEGEIAAGVCRPKVAIRIPGSGQVRYPDEYLPNVLLKEVKNVEYQSYTQQLRDYVAFAKAKGIPFELWVRPSTTLSKPLKQAIKNGDIIPKFLP